MAVDRETLYEEVWAEPMTKVAARYDVSSSFLARICERLNVPRPARGYWAQLEVGKAPAKPPLPEARPGDELAWTRGHEPPRVLRALPKPPGEQSPVVKRRRLPRDTRHPLVLEAREHFDSAIESEGGYLRPSKRRLLDLFVPRGTLDRALDTANALFLALEARGYEVTLPETNRHFRRPALDERSKGGRQLYGYRWGPDRPTVTYVGTVAIGLTFFELSEEVEVQNVDGKYVPVAEVPPAKRRPWTHSRDLPSGKLALRASSPYVLATWEKEWREGRQGELERKLPHIISELEAAAVTISKLVEEGERRAEEERQRWEIERERWQRQEAERRRVQNVKESREELFGIISAWGAAKQVESFFEDAERRAASLAEDDRAALLDRLHQARTFLGTTDALQRFLSWKSPEER